MARKKTPAPSRFAELLSTSEDNVNAARKRYEEARFTLTNAQTFGTELVAAAAAQAFVEASEYYATALRGHAHIVVDYAKERAR